MARYDAAFFESETYYATTSAAEIVPHVMELIAPTSVVDVGCGSGGWLATFAQHGVDDFQGYDGDWVDPALLQIDPARFRSHDLRRALPPGRRYDLALCLEVAEHLPSQFARLLVETLTSLAPVVVFSAAIPHQGGTGHINEQWQSWWAAHFAERDYLCVDCLRRRIWDNQRVSHWYCQNLLVYVARRELGRLPALARERDLTSNAMLDLVHPRMFSLAETSFPRLAKRALTVGQRTLRRALTAESPAAPAQNQKERLPAAAYLAEPAD